MNYEKMILISEAEYHALKAQQQPAVAVIEEPPTAAEESSVAEADSTLVDEPTAAAEHETSSYLQQSGDDDFRLFGRQLQQPLNTSTSRLLRRTPPARGRVLVDETTFDSPPRRNVPPLAGEEDIDLMNSADHARFWKEEIVNELMARVQLRVFGEIANIPRRVGIHNVDDEADKLMGALATALVAEVRDQMTIIQQVDYAYQVLEAGLTMAQVAELREISQHSFEAAIEDIPELENLSGRVDLDDDGVHDVEIVEAAPQPVYARLTGSDKYLPRMRQLQVALTEAGFLSGRTIKIKNPRGVNTPPKYRSVDVQKLLRKAAIEAHHMQGSPIKRAEPDGWRALKNFIFKRPALFAYLGDGLRSCFRATRPNIAIPAKHEPRQGRRHQHARQQAPQLSSLFADTPPQAPPRHR